jgi:hypothetical protein
MRVCDRLTTLCVAHGCRYFNSIQSEMLDFVVNTNESFVTST